MAKLRYCDVGDQEEWLEGVPDDLTHNQLIICEMLNASLH